jgi:AbrB family looped-hinge helix DNA binding protein
MKKLTVSSKGSVVIPGELRRKYDLRPGAQVMVVDYGGVLAVVPAFERPVEEAEGLLKSGPSLAKALRAERARERRRER